MSGYRKLGRRTDLRKALLKNQVTTLLMLGKITTTQARALEVRKIAEKLITLAVREHANYESKEVKVSCAKLDAKGRKMLQTQKSKNGRSYDVVQREIKTQLVQVDKPSRLAARRQLISALNEHSNEKGVRVNTVNHVFSEIAPKYVDRAGGYTRIIKLGQRRGDAAELVQLELV